ncbi:MAG: hypothetical protein AB1758_24125, partial [Candidatus Eremiobacterota bacterium]
MRHALLFLLLLSLPAAADTLTLSGKPFPGVVTGSGDGMKVELRPLMAALGLHGHRLYGGWCVNSRQVFEPDCPVKQLAGPGRVYLDGQSVSAEVDSHGRTLVRLSEVASRLGLRLEGRPGGMELNAEPPPDLTLPREPNADQPGAEVPLEPVPGKTSLVAYYLDWCPACWQV